jgi:hypothetical protein
MHTAGEYCMLTSIMPHAAVGIGAYALLLDVSKQRDLAIPLRPAGLPSRGFQHRSGSSTIKILETCVDTVPEIFPTLFFNRLLP